MLAYGACPQGEMHRKGSKEKHPCKNQGRIDRAYGSAQGKEGCDKKKANADHGQHGHDGIAHKGALETLLYRICFKAKQGG